MTEYALHFGHPCVVTCIGSGHPRTAWPRTDRLRFAVVVQSEDLPLSTWIIAPTSTGRRAASFRPEIEVNGVRTRVMVERLTVIDVQARLGELAGRLDTSDLQAVDSALFAVLGLD